MKQTSSALTFLLAQYRAIFKRAYIKGIASAVILTAGLAAGQAQAATTTDPFWTASGTDDALTWKPQEEHKNVITSSNITGGYADGTNGNSVSGAGLIIGAESLGGDVATTGGSGNAFGGYVYLDTGSNNAVATDNKLKVLSGGNIKSTGNLVGGWAKTNGSGIAKATGNQLIIDKEATLTSGGQFIGAVAAGLNGALAEGNSFTFSGDAVAPKALTNNGNYGATVFVGDATNNKEATKGTFEALGNTVGLSNFTISGDTSTLAQKSFVGGNVMVLNLTADNTVQALRAQGNTVDLSSFTLGASAYQNGYQQAQIIANNVVNLEATKHAVALVEANGEGETGVILNKGDIYGAAIRGGFAQNVSGGSATASNNLVSITDTHLRVSTSGDTANTIYNSVIGGYAESTVTDTNHKVKLTASGNVVNIQNKAEDKTKTTYKVQGDVHGAFLSLTSGTGGSIDNFVGSTLTANDNQVTIGEGIDVTDDSVFGVYLKSGVTSGGATLLASKNTLTINGSWEAAANKYIATVRGETGMMTANDNKLVINGKIEGHGAVVAAVQADEQVDIKAQKIEGYTHNLSNNSVEIGADAVINKAEIYAVLNTDNKAYTQNNDVTIAGKVTNSNIYGGTGADSVIDVQAGSCLTYNPQFP